MNRGQYKRAWSEIRALNRLAKDRLNRGADDLALEAKAVAEWCESKFPFNVLLRPEPIQRTLKQRADDRWGIPY